VSTGEVTWWLLGILGVILIVVYVGLMFYEWRKRARNERPPQ
jgi:integral membrane sensor domain MASE1